jgi:hypothetical protein
VVEGLSVVNDHRVAVLEVQPRAVFENDLFVDCSFRFCKLSRVTRFLVAAKNGPEPWIMRQPVGSTFFLQP